MRSRTRDLAPGIAATRPDSTSPLLMPDLLLLMSNALLTSMLPPTNIPSCYLLVTHVDRIVALKFEVKVWIHRSTPCICGYQHVSRGIEGG